MEGPAAYRAIVAYLRMVIRVFFRRVEVAGAESVPPGGGGILVAWHPNGLVDPGLILTHCPRQVVFGARSGLFAIPLLGRLVRAIGTVPIQRTQDVPGADPDARRAANRRSLDALARAVAEGALVSLFPEGVSHDLSHPMELKTGAAHLYYQARRLAPDRPPPALIPVGLHYDHKRAFRSEALVAFHAPMALPATLDVTPADDEAQRELARALTAEIGRVLHEIAFATGSWELHFLIRRTRKLMRAERAHRAGANPGRPDIRERTLGFARVWQGWQTRRAGNPDRIAAIEQRVREYDRDLRAMGLEDHELDRAPRLVSPLLGLLLVLQVLLVFLFFPPFVLVGYLVNLPILLAIWALTRGVTQKKKDEASLKVLIGAIVLPLAWLAAGVVAWLAHDTLDEWFPGLPDNSTRVALSAVAMSIAGGWLALHYDQMVRDTIRAVRVRLTRARRGATVARLRAERSALYEIVQELGTGLDLPGAIDARGRVAEDVRVSG